MTDEEKAEEYASKKCANCIRYYCKKQNKKKIGSIDCCNEYLFQRKHFLAGLAEGREERCNSCGLRQQKRINLTKENEQLKAQIENLEKDKEQIIFESDLKIKALEDHIEKMKCCGNCKYYDCCYVEVPCSCCIRGLDNENENDVDEWEIYD